MKRALVLGAGGFIGSHLVQQLIKEHYFVQCSSKNKIDIIDKNVEIMYGDLRNKSFVESLFENKEPYDEVYQLAARMGGALHVNTKIYDADIMSDSVLININIIQACVKYKTKMLFFASSACVYPTNKGIAICNEDDAYPAYPENGYGWEKIFTEQMLQSYNKQYGLEIRIARLHSIVGENSRWNDGKEKAHSALARKVAQVQDGGEIEVFGDGTQLRTFLHISDCIEGIRMLMQSNCTETINIGSDIPITICEYLQLLKSISGKSFTIRYIPNHISTGVKERYCQITKAKELIGWVPKISIEESTNRTYFWICQQLVYKKQPQNKEAEI
jgi:nucleoside-diphosphate-sugar epimerase